MDQLEKIWDLCGTPTEETWPDFKNLPDGKNMVFKTPRQNCIAERFSK